MSVITEGWRWGRITPPKGDTASVPLNAAGRKVAEAWDLNADRQGARTPGGSLEVVTTNLQAGYLRPNGVPYSERAVVKEFFDSFTLSEEGTWLIVTTVVGDPEYLTQEFVIGSQFKKESDPSRWNPRPCETPAPLTLARGRGRE